MRKIFHKLITALVVAGAYAAPAQFTLASEIDAANSPVHFIGFNDILEGEASSSTFDNYIDTIKPIMATHNIELTTFRVTRRINGPPADYITFGSAASAKDLHAFFSDPMFQKVFPQLVSITQTHRVVFVSGNLITQDKIGQKLSLQLSWENQLLTDSVKGLSANQGLAADITSFPAPKSVTLTTLPLSHNQESGWTYELAPTHDKTTGKTL
jgi:hypothetical protein